MNRLTYITTLLLSFAFSRSTALAEPPVQADPAEARLPETEDDPYVPVLRRPTDPGRASLAPPGAVQVNVNAMGQNIPGDAANEPSIAVDPTNPQRMAIGWRQFDTIASNFRQAGNAYSTDGGATWTFPGVLTPGVFRSDPILAADNAGRFFYCSLQTNFCMDVFQSANAGMTWPTSVAAFGGDKAWMDVDRTAGTGSGFLYSAWQNAARCSTVPSGRLFTRSTDHGATWMTPIAVTNSPRFGVTAVGPDGAVYVTGTGANLSTVVVAKSNNAQNGGVTPTWAFSVTGNFLGGAQVVGGGPNPAGLLGQVWIAANPANAAHVFLLCSVDPAGTDPLDVRFARSVDGGQTWAASVRVNDDSTSNNAWQWMGTMSVAPNGRIDAVWLDTRDDPLNHLSRLYYANSTNEGATWSANYALTPQFDSLVGFPSQNKMGDYFHMISDNAGAHLAFCATFNGEQDVYYMRITPNDCNRNGVPDNIDIMGSSQNCNGNALPDECELDCNHDGIADSCQLAGNDCNANNIPDDCEAGHEDCNNNMIFDQCEVGFVDCNHNGRMDSCDIASMASADCNGNNIPDECELPVNAVASDSCVAAQWATTGVVYMGYIEPFTTTDPGSGASCGASGRDVYFRYRPIVNGTLSASLCVGTPFDTVLSIHTGCPATSGNQLGCDDDGCGTGGGPSVVSGLAVTAGNTYLIRVAGFDNGTGGDVGKYVLTLTGPTGAGDCNGNGIPDDCEIAAGGDAGGNGILDICEPFPSCGTCGGDLNGDNAVNGADVTQFIACFLAFPNVLPACGCADMNLNHQINGPDLTDFVNKLLAGGCP